MNRARRYAFLLAGVTGLAALTALAVFGTAPTAHASVEAEPATAETSAPVDCQRGWDFVDPVTKLLKFDLTLVRASARDEFAGVDLRFDQAMRDAYESGQLARDEADHWGLGVGFGFDLPYLELAGPTPILRNATGTLTATSGTTADGRAYAYRAVTDEEHVVVFDERGQALVDLGPQGGALSLYYADTASLPPGSRASMLDVLVTPAGRPVGVTNNGRSVSLVDGLTGKVIADFSVSGAGVSQVWSDEAGFVRQIFLRWKPIEHGVQLGEVECGYFDGSSVTTAFTYAPAERGRVVDEVTITER